MLQERRLPVIMNFLPICDGGGLQNSLSFIETLGQDEDMKAKVVAVARLGSVVWKGCEAAGIRTIGVAHGRIGRLRFELSCRAVFRRGQTCFTLFGPAMLSASDFLLNINGCAYSNLFYPETAFWASLPPVQRIAAELVDCYRRRFTANADYWIFETETIKDRAVNICGFPEDRAAVVPMAVSRLVSSTRVKAEHRAEFDNSIPKQFRFLFLNGPNPNKRIHLLPAIASTLESISQQGFVFVMTMDPNAAYTGAVQTAIEARNVGRHFVNLGPIAPDKVSSLLACVDAMCTFSRLESFSNSFIEAWTMRLPLVVTDADWAKASCGDAALYVNSSDPMSCAIALHKLICDGALRALLVRNGRHQLSRYPDAEQKTRLYMTELDRASAMGPCPKEARRRIHWPSKPVALNERCVSLGQSVYARSSKKDNCDAS